MKVYVSADIEGIAGIADWSEATPDKPDYQPLRERMNAHVAAACEAAVAAGATEILVKDAHAGARNLFPDRLPECARVVRGWSGHPYLMVQEIDETFDALLMIGYHSRAGSGGNPMAHTLSSSRVAKMTMNGTPIAEFHVYGWTAALHGVPVALVCGDEALCDEVKVANEAIHTVPVMKGVGASTLSLHPDVAEARIRAGVEAALAGDMKDRVLAIPDRLEIEIRYKEAARAYRASFFPGFRQVDDHTVAFETGEYFEVLRALSFVV